MSRGALRLAAIRVCGLAAAVLGVDYIAWRWTHSIDWSDWWLAVPLALAETYCLVDCLLFVLTMWRLRDRPAPPPAPPGLTVDVFVTTYDEPLDLVLATARAAQRITYPHRTWILDDGDRTELRARAEAEGIGWITRSANWVDRPRHAKAGNLNNALLQTTGEFLLVLDADQVPDPRILDATLGYFTDPAMALVQTPQHFGNVPDDDPLGSQAPLFYGPIQQGKDGWNAAFFCGSNAVLRREALMQLGLSRYVEEVTWRVTTALRTADTVLRRARRRLDRRDGTGRAALREVALQVRAARVALRAGEPLAEITYRFQRAVEAVTRPVVAGDLAALQADLATLEEFAGGSVAVDPAVLDLLTRRDWSPLGALHAVAALLETVDVHVADEAQAVMPLATISVTEDMATCMRLHAAGWRTAYHHEVLAVGLAPEDLPAMLTQRLRWAQGTVQVLLRENPLLQRGLSLPQRLIYFASGWTYLSGFAVTVFLAAPTLYLLAGVTPVHAYSGALLGHLLPFLLASQLLFGIVGWGKGAWRGMQYGLALFPVWIRAVVTAAANVLAGRPLGFAVTPKDGPAADGPRWRLVRVQLAVLALLTVSAGAGIARLVTRTAPPLAVAANLVMVLLDLAIFSVVVRAARYRAVPRPAAEPSPAPTPEEVPS